MLKRLLVLSCLLVSGFSYAQSVGSVQVYLTAPSGACRTNSNRIVFDTGAHWCCGGYVASPFTEGTWATCDAGPAGSGYITIDDEDSALPAQAVLNFEGAGVDCVDDIPGSQTVCTIAGGGGGALDSLTDVTITTPATGAVLIKSGTDWIDGPVDLADSDAITGLLPVGNLPAANALDSELHTIFSPGVVTAHSDVSAAGSGAIITSGERTALHAIFSPGVVTAHSDVTNAGSGAIITAGERSALHTATPDQVGTVNDTEVCQGDAGGLVQCNIANLANLNTALGSGIVTGAHDGNCSTIACTVDLAADTITQATANRCARFNASGDLVIASGDCASGDTTIANTTCAGITCDLADDTANIEAANNSTTQLATTSFVQQEINGAGGTDLTCAAGVCNVNSPVTSATLATTATTANGLAAGAIDALGDFNPSLCSASEILERQGAVWACIATPTGSFTNFDITDDDDSPIRAVDNGEEIQFAGAGTVTIALTADTNDHIVTITGSAHPAEINDLEGADPTLIEDHELYQGNASGSGTFRPVPDCHTNNMLTYTRSTDTWGCDADDGAGGGAPVGVQYVVGSLDATLTAEKLLTDGIGIDTVLSGGDGGAATINLKYTDTLAGNPTFAAKVCVFTTEGTSGGGLLCEGDTGSNTNEQLYLLPAVDGADTTSFFAVDDKQVTDLEGTGLSIAGGVLNSHVATPDQVGTVNDTEVCQGDGSGNVQCNIAILANLNTALGSGIVTGAHVPDQVGTVTDGQFCQGGAGNILDCDQAGALDDDDLSDDLITALSGVTTVTSGSYCQGGATSTMDCDVTQDNIPGAGHIDALGELDPALCAASQILERQGSVWACISTPSGAFTNFTITDTDDSPIQTVDDGEEIQYAGAGTVTVDLTASASDHVVTITGSAHVATSVVASVCGVGLNLNSGNCDNVNATNGGLSFGANDAQLNFNNLVTQPTIADGDFLPFDDLTDTLDNKITFANFRDEIFSTSNGVAWHDSGQATFVQNFLLSGSSDPSLTASDGLFTSNVSIHIGNAGQIRMEESGGPNYVAFGAGALTANRICTMLDNAAMIPETCVRSDAGTNINADLEEEGQIGSTTVTGNAGAVDQMILGTGTNTAIYINMPSGGTDGCSAAGDKPIYTASTNSWSCGTDGGGAETNTLETLTTDILTNEICVGDANDSCEFIAIAGCNADQKIQYTDGAPNTFTCVDISGLTDADIGDISNFAADALDALTEIDPTLCAAGEILERGGSVWACITTPTSGGSWTDSTGELHPTTTTNDICNDAACSNWRVQDTGEAVFLDITTAPAAVPSMPFDDTIDGDATPESRIQGNATAADNGGLQFQVEQADNDYFEGITLESASGVVSLELMANNTANKILITEAGPAMTAAGTATIEATDLAAGALDLLAELDPALCAASQILERQGSVWACIATPAGGSETNTLTTVLTGITDDQVVIGGAGVATYDDVPDCDLATQALAYDTAANNMFCNSAITATAVASSVCGDGMTETSGDCDVTNATQGGLNFLSASAQLNINNLGTDTIATGDFLAFDNLGSTVDKKTTVANFISDLGISLFGTITDTQYCQGGAANVLDCDVTQDNIPGAGHIDALGELDPALCAASQILERQGSVWACIATPAGGSFSFNVTDTDDSPIQTVDNTEEIQFAGAGTVTIVLTPDSANHIVTITGSAHIADQVGTVNDGDFCQGAAGSVLDCDVSSILDASISNTLTSSIFIGSGSTTDAIDLASAEAAGILPSTKIDIDVRTGKFRMVLFAPAGLADTDDIQSFDRTNVAVTVTEIWCQTDDATGTPSVNFQRDDGSPANMCTADLDVTVAGATCTVAAAEDNVAADEEIDFIMTDAQSMNRLSCFLEYTID